MIEQLLESVAVGVGRLASQHVVNRAAQRVDVAANVHTTRITRLLGRYVVKRTQSRAV